MEDLGSGRPRVICKSGSWVMVLGIGYELVEGKRGSEQRNDCFRDGRISVFVVVPFVYS